MTDKKESTVNDETLEQEVTRLFKVLEAREGKQTVPLDIAKARLIQALEEGENSPLEAWDYQAFLKQKEAEEDQ